jgi:SAM-dependent methyltransferase
MDKSKDYYNKRFYGLLEDYVYGIERMENAISSLCEFIPPDSEIVADIGCGIGWSSFEIARFFPNAKVHGYDLSPVLIENATKLFNRENLKFYQKDITESGFREMFDCILMIDVYEHIPSQERTKFHQSLNECLTENGRLIFSCPTKFYQNWLRDNKPSGLQPVDEDVDARKFLKLADDIGGELIFLEYQKIWNANDYLYAVVEKKTNFQYSNSLRNGRSFNLEYSEFRANRVKERLNVVINKKKKKGSRFQNLKALKKIVKILNKQKKIE